MALQVREDFFILNKQFGQFKLDGKTFSSENKNELVRGIRTHDLTHFTLKSYSGDTVLILNFFNTKFF